MEQNLIPQDFKSYLSYPIYELFNAEACHLVLIFSPQLIISLLFSHAGDKVSSFIITVEDAFKMKLSVFIRSVNICLND